MGTQADITLLLDSLDKQDSHDVQQQLFEAVYDELCQMAHRQLNRRRSGQTLNTTALVHEAYLRLVDQTRPSWQGRSHFFGVAATAMRHILVDRARRRTAQKRGGSAPHTLLGEQHGGVDVDAQAQDILALDQALTHLNNLDERLGRVVELRFFGGLSVEETAEVIGTSPRTVKRDWRKARAFLYSTLHDDL